MKWRGLRNESRRKIQQTVRVVKGGDSRQDSVARRCAKWRMRRNLLLVHDAVRPFVTVEQITRVIEEARRCEAAILGIPAMDTVKEVKRASLRGRGADYSYGATGTVVLAQTPQTFSTKLLKEAFARAQADGVNASMRRGLWSAGARVHVVLGSERNMKITKPADMEWRVLRGTRAPKGMSTRCGIGYDLHRLESGRKLSWEDRVAVR